MGSALTLGVSVTIELNCGHPTDVQGVGELAGVGAPPNISGVSRV